MKKSDKAHLDRVASLGCVLCLHLGHEGTPCAIHHIRHGQGMAQRANHQDAIGLCHHHHQGKEGIHTLGTRAWEKRFGITEPELLQRVREELGIAFLSV